MDPVEIFRGHHISNFEKKIREITDYMETLVELCDSTRDKFVGDTFDALREGKNDLTK